MKNRKLPLLSLLALGASTLAFTSFMAPHVSAVTTPTLGIQFTPSVWSAPGDPVTVTSTLTNTDPTLPITDATIKLSFKSGKFKPTLITTEGGFTCSNIKNWKYSIQRVICTGGTVPANGSVAITYQIPTKKDHKKTSPTVFKVEGTVEPYALQGSASLPIVPYYMPDLVVKGSATPQASLVGGTITYKFKVHNNGYAPSVPTTVLVTLPSGATQSVNVPVLMWKQNSAEFSIPFVTTIAGDAMATFQVDPADLNIEWIEANNTKMLKTQVYTDLPELAVVQTQPDSVNRGDEFTKTLTVTNNGTLPASEIVLKDQFSDEKALSVVGDHGFTCTTTFKQEHKWSKKDYTGYKCVGGILNPGESATVTVMLKASNWGGTVKNKVTVDPGNKIIESNEENNTLSDTITVVGPMMHHHHH